MPFVILKGNESGFMARTIEPSPKYRAVYVSHELILPSRRTTGETGKLAKHANGSDHLYRNTRLGQIVVLQNEVLQLSRAHQPRHVEYPLSRSAVLARVH